MEARTSGHVPGRNTLTLCLMDILIALTAMQVVLLMPGPGAWSGLDAMMPENVVHFLVIAAFPSMLLGIILAHAANSVGLAARITKTALSVAASYVIFLAMDETRLPGRLAQGEAMLGLAVFAVLSIAWETMRGGRLAASASSRCLLVGNGVLAERMESAIRECPERFELVGRVEYPAPGQVGAPGEAEELLEMAKRLGAGTVVLSLTERRGIFPLQEMLSCKLSGIEVLDSPDMFERITGKLLIENITPSWFIFCHGFRVTPALRTAKRCLDVVLSLLGLTLFAPFFPLVALAVKLDSPGPVFFRQVRVGFADKEFELFKFRTMRADAEAGTGAVWAKKDDPRVTRLGRFMRKCRIDEIPQLLNVLRGEMSLVGPRPERPEFVRTLKERIPYYSERHYVKPGVSGWAQVRYPYGASVEDAVEKLRYDLYYIKNISLLLDLRIIFMTMAVVLRCRGGR